MQKSGTRRVIVNIKELVTLSGLASGQRTARVAEADLGLVPKAWLAIEAGKVHSFGSGFPPPSLGPSEQIDAADGLVLPGLVDVHTHPLFAGNRFHEFVLRAAGESYQSIAAKGGGILASLKATREASDAELSASLCSRLDAMRRRGVTSLEAKTGYGLSVEEELRQLKIYQATRPLLRQALSVTALPLHALPPEHAQRTEFVEAICRDFLPRARGLAESVDAFIEQGYFLPEELEAYARRAKELGFDLRVHAEEFSRSGAASFAARWGARSADHLQFAEAEDAKALAAAGTTAVLLPGTSLYTKIPFADGRKFIEAGCAVAIASDFNPGSCYLPNLAMMAGLAAVHSGLSGPEALAGVTIQAARSVRSFASKGALAPGFDADFSIYRLSSWQEFLADFGQTLPTSVWTGGES